MAILAGVALFGCRSPGRIPEPQETAPSPAEPPAGVSTPKNAPSVEAWAPQIDACADASVPCRAASALDVQLRQIPRDQRFAFLLRLLAHPSPRVMRHALYRMYPFRHRAELVPFIEKILETSQDPALLKLAAALALTSDSPQAATAFMRHYGRLPADVRNSSAWAIRMNYTRLDVNFLQQLHEDASPVIRAAAMEIESVHADSPEALVACVRALGPDAAACAVSMARTAHPDIGRALVSLVDEWLHQAESARRPLFIPPEVASTVELLHGQKRMDAATAADLLEKMLASRKLDDAIRAQAALSLGRVRGRDAMPVLQRFRKDPRKKVGYAVRRALYLLEREP